jgi:hypothetical protein
MGVCLVFEAVRKSMAVIAEDPELKKFSTLQYILRWCHTFLIDKTKFPSEEVLILSAADKEEETEIKEEDIPLKRARVSHSSSSSSSESSSSSCSSSSTSGDLEPEPTDKVEEKKVLPHKKRTKTKQALGPVEVNIYVTSGHTNPYSLDYIDNWWHTKMAKKHSKIPDEDLLFESLFDLVTFSLWYWSIRPRVSCDDWDEWKKHGTQAALHHTLSSSSSSSSSASSSSSS